MSLCDTCKNPECCHDLVMGWKNLPANELDDKITEFMNSTITDFVTTRCQFTVKSHILDNDLCKKLEQSFTRLAPHYIDPDTEDLIGKWKTMGDEDMVNELVHLQTDTSKDEFYRIWAFVYPEELNARAEKLLSNNVIPKVRQINLINMLETWEHLSDKELLLEVKKELDGTGWNSSTSHLTFVTDLYPSIKSEILRKRVDEALLSLLDPRKAIESDRALYACSHLEVSGTVEAYQGLVHQMKQESKKM